MHITRMTIFFFFFVNACTQFYSLFDWICFGYFNMLIYYTRIGTQNFVNVKIATSYINYINQECQSLIDIHKIMDKFFYNLYKTCEAD